MLFKMQLTCVIFTELALLRSNNVTVVTALSCKNKINVENNVN